MSPDEKFTQEEVKEIVDQMARTLAMLYYFLSSEVVGELGPAGEEVIRRAIHKYGDARGSKIREKVLDKGLPLFPGSPDRTADRLASSVYQPESGGN